MPASESRCPQCGKAFARAARGPAAAVLVLGLAAAGIWILFTFGGGKGPSDGPEERSEAPAVVDPAGSSPAPESASQPDLASAGGSGASSASGSSGPPAEPSAMWLDRVPDEPARDGSPSADRAGDEASRVAARDVTGLSSVVFLQFFGPEGELWRESVGALVDASGGVVLAGADLPGAFRGRGWTADGRFVTVADVLAIDLSRGLGVVRVEGKSLPRPMQRAATLEISDSEPVTLVAPSMPSSPRASRGTIASADDGPPAFRYEGPSTERGGLVLNADGELAGIVLPTDDERATAGLAAEAFGPLLAGTSPRTLESFYRNEYEGTWRFHIDRARSQLAAQRFAESLTHYLEGIRLHPYALDGEEIRLGTALLGAIERARASARYALALGPIEELLALEATPGIVHVHAGRLFLEMGRHEAAVEQLLLAARVGGSDLESVAYWLKRAYLGWAQGLAASGRLEDSLRVLEEAYRQLGSDAVLAFEVGKARMAIGDYEGARIALEDSLSLDPGMEPVVRPVLDEVYRHLGDDGVLTIDIPRDTRLIPVDVWIDRRTRTTLYIDSGASWTFITRELAMELGINPDAVARRARFSTANGDVVLPVVVLDEVNFRGFIVRNVEAGIGNLDSSFGGGVLGNNFLRHFTITIDRPRGKMTFEIPR